MLEEAVKALEDKLFWESFNLGAAKHGAELPANAAAWDGALMDGLPVDEAGELAAWDALEKTDRHGA